MLADEEEEDHREEYVAPTRKVKSKAAVKSRVAWTSQSGPRDSRTTREGTQAVHPPPHEVAGRKGPSRETEQTLFCELEAEQRKLYDELRDH
jgi:hypothetical protein